ncbi:MAG: hypothetical protein K9H49_06230 [Bacteroidales bacterium]|nr:hypothetical protein [Bacteroidales bacterium]MCF8405067.1 hypothetical protein [Bacteroidales bacterium]
MRKLTFLIVLICSIQFVGSQNWIEFATSESTVPLCDVTTSTDTLVELEITVPGMFSTAVDSFNRVRVEEHFLTDSVGFPEMPVISFLVAIPECVNVNNVT